MYLYIHTFYYLKKAEETGCFNSKVNLKYMEIFQMIEIIAVTLSVLFLPKLSKMKNVNVALFMVIVVLAINAYMAMNVYEFYIEMKMCPLMNTWNKWWLYWEGISATISSLRGILIIALLISLLCKRKMK